MSVHIRAVQPHEWRELRALRLRALATDPPAFGRTLDEEQAMPDAAWVERATGSAENETFVAADPDGAWRGMATALVRGPSEVELVGMWVAPEARGAGAGRALVERVVAWASERDAARVTLWVNAANAGAIALYERCGFARDGEPQRGSRDPTRWFLHMTQVA